MTTKVTTKNGKRKKYPGPSWPLEWDSSRSSFNVHSRTTTTTITLANYNNNNNKEFATIWQHLNRIKTHSRWGHDIPFVLNDFHIGCEGEFCLLSGGVVVVVVVVVLFAYIIWIHVCPFVSFRPKAHPFLCCCCCWSSSDAVLWCYIKCWSSSQEDWPLTDTSATNMLKWNKRKKWQQLLCRCATMLFHWISFHSSVAFLRRCNSAIACQQQHPQPIEKTPFKCDLNFPNTSILPSCTRFLHFFHQKITFRVTKKCYFHFIAGFVWQGCELLEWGDRECHNTTTTTTRTDKLPTKIKHICCWEELWKI